MNIMGIVRILFDQNSLTHQINIGFNLFNRTPARRTVMESWMPAEQAMIDHIAWIYMDKFQIIMFITNEQLLTIRFFQKSPLQIIIQFSQHTSQMNEKGQVLIQEVHFQFPSKLFLDSCTEIKDIKAFHQLLAELWNSIHKLYSKWFPIDYKKILNHYIFYCKEPKCRFTLVYYVPQSEFKNFRLRKYEINHVHKHSEKNLSFSEEKVKVEKKERVKKIEPLTFGENWDFLNSRDRFKTAFEKIQDNLSTNKAIYEISFKHNNIQTEEINTLIYSSEYMQQQFFKNHRSFCISEVNCRNNPFQYLKIYFVYTITCQLQMKFLFLMLSQDKKKMIETLFFLEGFQMYESIVIEDEEEMYEIVSQIREKYNLKFQILRRVDFKKFKSPILRKRLRMDIENLYLSCSETEFGKNLQKLLRYQHLTEEAYNEICQLVSKRELYCLAFMKKKVFVGFNLQISLNSLQTNKIEEFINEKQTSEEMFEKVYNITAGIERLGFFDLQERIQPILKGELDNIHFFRNIQACLTNEALKLISDQLIESFNFNYFQFEKEPNFEQLFIFSAEESFIVKKVDKIWVCTCGFDKIFSLPCRHMIKCLIVKEYNYLKCIDDYWKKKKENW